MLDRYLPMLLQRARALLRLPGGPPDRLAPGEVAKAARAVLALHEGLIGDRPLAAPATYAAEHLGAYLLWWWPQTYEKVRAALALAPMPAAPRMVDLGGGPAPGAAAALDALGGTAVCVDASAAALAEARALTGVETRHADLKAGAPGGPWDVAIAANVLVELGGGGAALLRSLDASVVVIVEPALRETGRALLGLRDEMLAEGRWQALAPCLTQRPCPALISPKDWCTLDVRWTAPPHVRQLAEATGLRADELLSFAPLVLGRSAPTPERELWRVVGVPRPEKGKRRLFVCSDQGRLPVARLDKHQGPRNAAFDGLGRGDLVRLRGLDRRGDGLRVTPDSDVERK